MHGAIEAQVKEILPTPKPSRRARSISVRRVRLASGLVLFTYVTLHFANHALGNISVDAMEKGLALQKLLWQSPPGAILLYGALLIHMSLGFWALYERRQFRWTRLEATQLTLGLLIPFLLADHTLGTRVALSVFGIDKGYAQELFKFWVGSPPSGALQAILLLIVWIHLASAVPRPEPTSVEVVAFAHCVTIIRTTTAVRPTELSARMRPTHAAARSLMFRRSRVT
jgi:adenylate cyclase